MNINGENYNYTLKTRHTNQSSYSGVHDENVNMEDSVYSDGNDSFLHGQAHATASRGKGGMQANAGVGGSVTKHRIDDCDIHCGQATASGGASLGNRGGHIGANLELNAVSVKHKNFQARVGLNATTGVGFSTTDVTVSAAGVGCNLGLNGIGLSSPFGSFTVKPR